MESLDRRSAILLGAAIVTPLVSLPRAAAAAMYAADAGKEILPGIRQVELGKWPLELGAYKNAVFNDYIAAPGAGIPEDKMPNDILCHVLEGEFQIKRRDREFTVKAGEVYSCTKDLLEAAANAGSVPAVMRVIDLLPS